MIIQAKENDLIHVIIKKKRKVLTINKSQNNTRKKFVNMTALITAVIMIKVNATVKVQKEKMIILKINQKVRKNLIKKLKSNPVSQNLSKNKKLLDHLN